jgi:hypothetical protein
MTDLGSVGVDAAKAVPQGEGRAREMKRRICQGIDSRR